MSEILDFILKLKDIAPATILTLVSLSVAISLSVYFRKRLTADFDSFKEALDDHAKDFKALSKETMVALTAHTLIVEKAEKQTHNFRMELLKEIGDLTHQIRKETDDAKSKAAELERMNLQMTQALELSFERFNARIQSLVNLEDEVKKLHGSVTQIDENYKGFQVRTDTRFDAAKKLLTSHNEALKKLKKE